MSGSNGSPSGFSFTAPPLIYDGQNVGGNFNFALPLVQASSTTQAYQFVGGATAAADSFLGSAIDATNKQVFPLLNLQTNYLAQLGNEFAAAAQTAASNIQGSGGGLFGFLF